VSERDAYLALNLLPFTPAELRRLLDRCGDAAEALEAVGSGAIRAEDLALRPLRPGPEDALSAETAAAGPEWASDDGIDPARPGIAPRPVPLRNEVPLDHGAAQRLGAEGLLRLARLELRRARTEAVRVETLADPGYPASLREIPDPPPVLYIGGTLGPDDEPRIGIVGSRRATPYGLEAASLLAGDLARAGATIVSGLARGIDGCAHRGALDANGRTIAVLGSGLGRLYPGEHRMLARRIVEHGGAVLSEYPFSMPPLPQCFPRRNRVISGLSAGIVVVEAAKASGALGTARLALDQGREVFAVPGPATNPTSIGTNGLLRAQAAHIACVAQDVLDELPVVTRVRLGLPETTDLESEELRRAAIGRPLGAPLPVSVARAFASGAAPGLDPETRGVLRHLRSGASLSIDELVARCGLPVPRALAALSILETLGLAVTLPGDRIARTRTRLV
jgi:DNA processing protein